MPEHHHSKIEHLLIHLVAALFTFSTISAAFLAYGVYQTTPTPIVTPTSVISPKIAQSAGPGHFTWGQTSWTGGTSTSSFAVPWNTSGGWDKYVSAANVTIDSNGIHDDGSGTGQLISTIFDLGTERLSYVIPTNGGTVETRSGDSTSAIESASWGTLGCPDNHRYTQYKLTNLPSGYYGVTQVSFGSILVVILGTITDASTGNPITGATVSSNGTSTTTAFNQPASRFSLIKQVEAAGQPTPGSYTLSLGYTGTTSYNITASATGYQSQTKTVGVDPYVGCSYSATANFALSKPTGVPPSGQTSTKTSTTPSVSLTEFQQIKLPAVFTAAGSTTTDLSKVTDNKKVESFTLDIPGKNKIIFKEALDLSAKTTADALKELDKYIKIASVGMIELNSKTLPALNKKAALTMSGLKYLSTPTVLVDGKTGSKGVVSSIKYAGGTLTFNVSHFTKYEAAAKFELLAPVSTSISSANTIVKVKISDPEAVVTGTFNEVNLAKISPDPKTGEFVLEKLVFKEGENTLKLSGQSKLGKVAPLTVTFFYGAEKTVAKTSKTDYQALIVVLVVALAFAILLGYLIYRRKKLHSKTVLGGEKKQAQEQSQSQT